jgi:hypothetical protein
MKPGALLVLFLLGLAFALGAAYWQRVPGYMDAEYSYAGALRLAQGQGFSELVLWNYLDDPGGLPHPSHAYWMPLVSLLAAAGLRLAGALGLFASDFARARLLLVVLAACVPPVTAGLAWALTARRDLSYCAGLLAVFGGFYLPYLTTTDSFAAVMLLGSGLLAALPIASDPYAARAGRSKAALLGGLLAGLMHLGRADGLLWLALGCGLIAWRAGGAWRSAAGPGRAVIRPALAAMALFLVGYLLLMAPWLARNLLVFGAPLAPGASKALWLTDYNELFIYPASLLTPQRWWAGGLADILADRGWALGQNLQTALAVQSEILLLPFVLAASWRLRQDWRVRTAWAAWLLTLAAMTLAFPYAGARGGFFHSGAALQPFIWAIAPFGLALLVEWVGRRRAWNIPRAGRVFQIMLLAVLLLLSVFVFYSRVIGAPPPTGAALRAPAWETGQAHYQAIEAALLAWGARPGELVLVNNPPAYFIATGRPAIAIPHGDLQALLEVAGRYRGAYFVLEFDQLGGEDRLYDRPGDRLGLVYLGSVGETRLYRIEMQ